MTILPAVWLYTRKIEGVDCFDFRNFEARLDELSLQHFPFDYFSLTHNQTPTMLLLSSIFYIQITGVNVNDRY
jgi:hypothetical protein